MAEAAMSREFLLRRRVFPRMDNSKKKREKYEGAFVVDPLTGLYEWVTSFDFASLYPSIMRQWNISPESYLRNVLDKSEVDFENEILCSSGAVFRKNEDSVFRSILTDYYAQRKVSKNTYEEIEQEIDMLKQYIKN
jgi:DNA polymerase elongation subunit (family B)